MPTVIELLDVVLVNPIFLFTRTEERDWWDLERCLHSARGDIIYIVSRPTVETFCHATKYELLLNRKSAGGGLATVRSVARKVRRISLLSSAMAVDVWSAK
jgi:hypothetical protein